MVGSMIQMLRTALLVGLLTSAGLALSSILVASGSPDSAYAAAKAKSKKPSPVASTAIRYVYAMAASKRVLVGRLDFACQYRMVAGSKEGLKSYPKKSNPIYQECVEPIHQVNLEPVQTDEQGMYVIWPGKDRLVFFADEQKRDVFAPSSFVSGHLGKARWGGGFVAEPVSTTRIGIASFRLRPDADTVGAPAHLVELRIHYTDPLNSPLSYAPGTYQWANPVKRPRLALKAVTVRWVVLSDLKKLGFPGNYAVLNLPAVEGTAASPAVPFVTEYSGYVKGSAEWWAATDKPALLVAAVGRAAQLQTLSDRVAMLNRILIIDPEQADALTALSRDLYQAILENGAASHQVRIKNRDLAARFTEFYWDTYAQTDRIDISLGMEMGGYTKPTTADYLFRMIPAMEKLAELRPNDLENRFRLGIAYRWNLDQLTAIEIHEALVEVLPPDRSALRARALTELAWSRITKAAFNRTFDDPGVRQAYKEAEEALNLSDNPTDKFAAAYTMAYSLVFTPERENQAILRLLTEAKRWYMDVPGATEASWGVLLGNETLRPVIDADPSLHVLLAPGDNGITTKSRTKD